MVEAANRRRHARASDILVGDQVLIKKSGILRRKDEPYYDTEPMTVTQVKGSMVTAANQKKESTRNSSFFKKVHFRENQPAPVSQDRQQDTTEPTETSVGVTRKTSAVQQFCFTDLWNPEDQHQGADLIPMEDQQPDQADELNHQEADPQMEQPPPDQDNFHGFGPEDGGRPEQIMNQRPRRSEKARAAPKRLGTYEIQPKRGRALPKRTGYSVPPKRGRGK